MGKPIYTCQHCSANLDNGDILEHFMSKYQNDLTHAMASASSYGWSVTNKLHFNRSITVQPENDSQYEICPDCNKIDPLQKTAFHNPPNVGDND